MWREIIRLRNIALAVVLPLIAVGAALHAPGTSPDATRRATADVTTSPVAAPLVGGAEDTPGETGPDATPDATIDVDVAGEILLDEVAAAPVRVYFNNFDDPEFLASGVTGGMTLAGAAEPVQGYAGLGQAGNQFGGKFWRNTTTGNPAQRTRLILSGVPAHRSINVRFLLAIIDSWDGSTGGASPDYFNVAVNGVPGFSKTFDIFNLSDQSYVAPPGGQLTYNTQRGFNGSYNDAAYDMGLDPVFAGIPHSASILAIDFFASGGGWQGGNDESWAIENLEVLISDVGPEPGLPFIDAISREVSVYMPDRPFSFTDAISREVSVLAYEGPHPAFTDAVSREVSVFTPAPPVEFTDAISREVSVFTVIPITLGTAYQGALPIGSQAYFRLTTPADLTVRITLDHASTTAWTQLYASLGKLPADADSDFVFSNPSAPDQEVIIFNSQAGTYYILVRATTDSNPSASKAFTLLAAAVPFGVDGVQPPIVGAGEEVTLRVTGGHLDLATSICLHPSGGGADICPVKTTFADAAHGRLRFNLLGAPLGAYDVISESPTDRRVLGSAVTLQPPNEIRLDQQVIASPALARRRGAIQGIQGTTTINLRNPTNVDVPFAFLEIFAPASPDLSLILEGPDEQPFTDTDLYETAEFVIESIGPGEELNLPVRIDLARGFLEPMVQIYATSTTFTRRQVRDGFLLGEGGEVDRWLEQYRATYGSSPEFENEIVPIFRNAVDQVFDEYGFDFPELATAAASVSNRPLLKCLLLCGLKRIACQVAAAFCGPLVTVCMRLCDLAFISCSYCCAYPCDVPACRLCPCPPCDLPCGGPPNCPNQCSITWYLDGLVPRCGKICVPGNCTPFNPSADPNEKVGPGGFGEERFVDPRTPFTYRVYFENVGSGPAAEVVVTDTLDSALDVSSFRVNKFHFGETTVDVPEGRSSFDTILDFTAEMNLLVQLQGGLDSPTHKATFALRALDPQTRQIPSELDRGFLPPNDDTGRGEGYVEFTMKPLVSAVHTGTVIRNKAPIVFDFNDPIFACAPGEPSAPNCVGWFNTIDSGAPSSNVVALPTDSLTPFVVRWTGLDDAGGSGIGNYAVSVKTDTGAFVPWRTSTGTWGYFAGEVGKTYAFYTVAADNVGNAEATPSQPDSTTRVSGRWVGCLAGPGAQPPPGCVTADLDGDSDVDLKDFAALQLGLVTAPPP